MFPVSYVLPKTILTNEELKERFKEYDVSKRVDTVGIIERRVCSKDEPTSKMLYDAGRSLLDEYSIAKESIEGLVCVTQQPDHIAPNVGSKVCELLELNKNVLSYDINLGCSGFVYGVLNASSLIKSGIVKNVLVLTGGSRCKYIRKDDVGTNILFGDASAGFFINEENIDGIEKFVFGTDGTGYNNIIIKPDSEDDIYSPSHYYMNNINVFTFSITEVPKLVNDTLEKNKLKKDDIDFFVLHQANKKILETIQSEIDIDKDKMFIDLSDTGNTSSSSIPIALKKLDSAKKLKKGMKILIAGFGVGFSYAATVIRW